MDSTRWAGAHLASHLDVQQKMKKTIIILLLLCYNLPLIAEERPEFTVGDLARVQSLWPVLVEFPEEMKGATVYYEYSTVDGAFDWGRAFEVPDNSRYLKIFVNREKRGLSYVSGTMASGLQQFRPSDNYEDFPYFNFSPGSGGEPVNYKDFRLAFGATWHAPQLAMGGGRTPGNPENHEWFLVRLVDSLPEGFIVEPGEGENE